MEEEKRRKSKKKSRSGLSDGSLPQPRSSNAAFSRSPDYIQSRNQEIDSDSNVVPLANGEARDQVLSVGDLQDKTGIRPTQILGPRGIACISGSKPLQSSGPEDVLEISTDFEKKGRENAGMVSDNLNKMENHLLEDQVFLREELTAKEHLVGQLREALAAETTNAEAFRVAFDELRNAHTISENQVQQLRAEAVQLREAGLKGEIEHLKVETVELREMLDFLSQKEVEEMKEMIEQLLLERRQLTAKMVAMQRGMHQLEHEATIRARVEDELAVVTPPDSTKGWLSWGSSKDSVAEAAADAEESRIQMEAAATMVKNLVNENAELVEKVNEQSALIDRLTKKYSSVMELQSNGALENPRYERDNGVRPTNTGEVVKEHIVAEALREVLPPKIKIVSNPCDEVSEAHKDVVQDVVLADSIGKAVLGVEHDQLKSELTDIIDHPSAELMNPENSHQVAIMKPNESKLFSDAPIMGAPIRIFSFIAKYVSGADLVRVESS